MTYLSALPLDLKNELDQYRTCELRDMVNEQFKKHNLKMYGHTRKMMEKDIAEVRSILGDNLAGISVVFDEIMSGVYKIYPVIDNLVTFRKLTILFNHILTRPANFIVHELNDIMWSVLQDLDDKLSEHKYSERFIVFPHNHINRILVINENLLI